MTMNKQWNYFWKFQVSSLLQNFKYCIYSKENSPITKWEVYIYLTLTHFRQLKTSDVKKTQINFEKLFFKERSFKTSKIKVYN